MPTTIDRAIARLRGSEPPPDRPPVVPSGLPTPEIRGLDPALRERAEADLCDVIAGWLRADRWQVFFEVPLGPGRPDVVGVRESRTAAIEAKLSDVPGVVRQGLRIARHVDEPWIALPPAAAGEAGLAVARVAVRHPGTPLPGVLAVTRTVRVLRAPSGAPRTPVGAERLLRLGLAHGAARGGTPGGDRIERDARLWAALAAGRSLREIAAEAMIEAGVARTALLRLRAAREHLALCTGCEGSAAARLAHRHPEVVAALPEVVPGAWRSLG